MINRTNGTKIGFDWVCFHQVSNWIYYHNSLYYMDLHSFVFSIIGFVLHNSWFVVRGSWLASRVSYSISRILHSVQRDTDGEYTYGTSTYGINLGFAGHWGTPLSY